MIVFIFFLLKCGCVCVLKDVFFYMIYFIVVIVFFELVEGVRKVCFEWKLKDLFRVVKFYILWISFKKGLCIYVLRYDVFKCV